MRRVSIPPVMTSPRLATGSYFYPLSPFGSGTNGALGVGSVRVAPWVVYTTISLSALAGEITTVGEAGSKLRLGIWADTGAHYPGALVVDAGQIAGDSATVQQLTVSVTLTPGVYWLGAAVQTVTTTQPTVRILNAVTDPTFPISAGTSLPAGGQAFVGLQSSAAGAFTTFPAGAAATNAVPRLIAKVG